jgi:hypothetical protein
MSTNVYVLPLEGGNYYVGKSKDPVARCAAHFSGEGAAWTKLYKPIAPPTIFAGVGHFAEDMKVKELMLEHGIEKVRGGAYPQVTLRDAQIEALRAELWAATDRCVRCGRDNHFVASCYTKTDVMGSVIVEETKTKVRTAQLPTPYFVCGPCGATFAHEAARDRHSVTCGAAAPTGFLVRAFTAIADAIAGAFPARCEECGRTGHTTAKCYASTHVDGRKIMRR